MAALFIAVATITATLVALAYPIRIMLPKAEEEARRVAAFAVFCSIGLGVAIFVSTLALPNLIFVFLGLSPLGPWLGAAIAVGVMMALINVVNYWFNRNQKFKHMAALKIAQSASTAAGGLLLGLMSVNTGLLYAQIITTITVLFTFFLFSSMDLK